MEFAVKICNIIFICFSDQNSAHILEDFVVYSLFSGRNAEMKLATVEVFIIFWMEKQMNTELFKNVSRILARKKAEVSFRKRNNGILLQTNWWE